MTNTNPVVAHVIGDHVGGSDANFCPRHHGLPGGTVTAVWMSSGARWLRVAFPDGSYCEGPAIAFVAAESVTGERSTALALPAGWIEHQDGTGRYLRRTILRTAHINVAPDGVYVVPFLDKVTESYLVHEMGQALLEAADLFDQVRTNP